MGRRGAHPHRDQQITTILPRISSNRLGRRTKRSGNFRSGRVENCQLPETSSICLDAGKGINDARIGEFECSGRKGSGAGRVLTVELAKGAVKVELLLGECGEFGEVGAALGLGD